MKEYYKEGIKDKTVASFFLAFFPRGFLQIQISEQKYRSFAL